ncbi:protein FAM151A [Paramormyrops kingsleyae]|uniref:protein FAM151A n=1 Tax=Paramormyrops kingsleyae TaxID=1676925 RepID=UPI003B96D615
MKNGQKERGEAEKEAGVQVRDPGGRRGFFSRKRSAMLATGISLALLLAAIITASVLASRAPDTPPMMPFPTGGDMLQFLYQSGDITDKDGLQVTWYHAANKKSEMEEALKSSAMVLEADVNIQGHNTANETSIPIMAHPPDVYSDNTLQDWLDRVLQSKKGVKLDFKSIKAVEPSLQLLRSRNQTGISRPLWLNADILPGPNVPAFWPVVNSTRFLELIQMKFPEATISPGWAVLYVPIFPNVTYSRSMVEQMYQAIRNVPQRVTFPVLAVMVRRAWPHFSWLLSQSPRFSLTLWQGTEDPSVSDLLFVRDNMHPQRVYYDLSQPVLSHFREAAGLSRRLRRFYPGGDLIDYFKPPNKDGVNIQWNRVSDRTSLLSVLGGQPGGMLIIPVGSKPGHSDDILVGDSTPQLPLQEFLGMVLASPKPWGLFLQIPSQTLLAPTLALLNEAFDNDQLRHPIWINMNLSHGTFQTPGYIDGQEFLNTINRVFPYVTLAPSWPREALALGYTSVLVEDMMALLGGAWQDVALQVLAVPLGRSYPGRQALLQAQPRMALTVHHSPEEGSYHSGYLGLMSARGGNIQRTFYSMPSQYMNRLHMDVFTS